MKAYFSKLIKLFDFTFFYYSENTNHSVFKLDTTEECQTKQGKFHQHLGIGFTQILGL